MFSANARRRQGERRPCCTQCGRPLPSFRFLALAKGKIHRVDPDFGSTLTVSNRDSQSNCWVNWKIMGRPCEFQVFALRARPPPPPPTHTHGPGLPELTAADRPALCAGAQRHAHGGGPRARRAGGRCVLPAVVGVGGGRQLLTACHCPADADLAARGTAGEGAEHGAPAAGACCRLLRGRAGANCVSLPRRRGPCCTWRGG
jgi:hypothetical protein